MWLFKAHPGALVVSLLCHDSLLELAMSKLAVTSRLPQFRCKPEDLRKERGAVLDEWRGTR